MNSGKCAGWDLRIATNGWRYRIELMYNNEWISISQLDFFDPVGSSYPTLEKAQEALKFLCDKGRDIWEWTPVE